jgi:hypothetical protein
MKFMLGCFWFVAGTVILGVSAPGMQAPVPLSGILMIDDMEGGEKRSAAVALASPEILVIDNMEGVDANVASAKPSEHLANPTAGEEREPPDTNSLGARTGVYQQAPSSAKFAKSPQYGKDGAGLMITYNKKSKGGASGNGGFCGYYTLLHSSPTNYLDASAFEAMMFWVKGAKGDEKFCVGVADEKWALVGNSVKSKEVGSYLPAGKITTDWQMAVIPLKDFRVDLTKMHSLAICFEGNLFPNGAGRGTVFIDEMAFTKPKSGAKP